MIIGMFTEIILLVVCCLCIVLLTQPSFFRHTVKDRDLTALQKKYSDVESRLADLESKLAAALRDADHWKQQHQVSCLSIPECKLFNDRPGYAITGWRI